MISDLLAIYTQAIPPSERKSEVLFRAMLDDPGYKLQVAHRHGRIVGFSLTRLFIARDTALLEYLAVAAEYRGQGIGQSLFQPDSGFTLVEVDTDNTRLQNFYRKQGARQLERLHYRMPSVCLETPPAMNLWVASQLLPASVPLSQIQTWLQGIYTHVYKLPPDDPRIKAMLRQLPNQVNLT